MSAVQFAAHALLLERLERLWACDTEEALSRVTRALGSNPSYDDLRGAYVRVLNGDAL